ncbi:hypothetical protein HDV64DRAFT_239517 [Trichoderma sp. TUCIM 5745]
MGDLYLHPHQYYPCVIFNCRHSYGLERACHLICAAEGLPSFKTFEVTLRDPRFELPSTQPADPLMLHMAQSTLQVEKKITEVSTSEVKTSSCIWATFITLHNEIYVSTLSNTCGDTLIYNPNLESTADVIYIARGPLGIKKLIFARSTDTLEIENNLWDWWQTLPFTTGCVLRSHFDGLKLRDLLRPNQEELPLPLWSAPTFRQDLAYFALSQSLKPAKFNRVMINHPETTGYSVAWNAAHRSLRIIRHTSKDSSSGFTDMPEDTTIWLYIPINHGELLKEIWRRSYLQHYRETVDLILVTTNGRIYVLGNHPTPGHIYSYSRIATLQSQPDYLYVDQSAGIRELALNPAPNVDNTALEGRLPAPKSDYPAITPTEKYFYTSAPLLNLSSIKICKFRGVITGILLNYYNGSQASLGHVRHDLLSDAQQIPRDATIRFAVSRTDDKCPYVSNVLLITPDTTQRFSPANLGFDLEVTCCGLLEWWFTRRQCQLAHEGRSSVPTRI